MIRTRQLLFAAFGLLAITTAGTVGYVVIEGATLREALYMTVLTLSTVGFREIIPLSPAGQFFTIGLIVLGVGAALYLLSVMAQGILAGGLRENIRRSAMQREVDRIDEHVIVCGYGRFGRVVVQDLVHASRAVVVIEQDPGLEATLLDAEVPHLIGSATSDDVLHRAGIERASAIIVALSSESDGVFVTLSARELSPSIKIHARGESEAAVRRLRRAGADHVTSPIRMGGLRAAESILRPAVVDLLEISSPLASEEIDLEEIRIGSGAAIDGAAVRDVESGLPRLRIVALKRGTSPIEIVPERDAVVSAGDHVVVIGERSQLAELAARALARDVPTST